MKRIKISKNKDARVTVIKEVRKKLKEVEYFNKVAVNIYGKIYHMTEPEILTLQILAKEAYKESEECFKQFCDNVVVYSGRTVTHSDHVMHFRKDGKFEEKFEKGFISALGKLVAKILFRR